MRHSAEHFLPGGAAVGGWRTKKKLGGRDGGVKMDWTEPLHDARPMCFDCHLDPRWGLRGMKGRAKATRVRVAGRRDGASGLVVRVSVDGIGCCWISSLT